MQKKLHYLLMIVTSSLLLSGCGGGGSTSPESSSEESAIERIYQYAQDENTAPTVQDYLDAGITGVTEENLDTINMTIATLTPEEVDTRDELQAIVDSLSNNKQPSVDAGQNRSVEVNHSVTITGSAYDTDGTIVSYTWKEGNTVLANTLSFTYTPTTAGTHLLTLTVVDNDGAFATDSVTITVTETQNAAPVANAGEDRSVQVNQTITITGSGTDSDGDITSYEWKEGTTLLATTASFNYTPTSTGNHILTLTVTDNNGATASDTMVVTVTEDNTVHITEEYQVERLGTATSINTTVSIDTAETKDLYLVLSNYDEVNSASVSISHSNKIAVSKETKTVNTKTVPNRKQMILPTPSKIRDFNNHIFSRQSSVERNQKVILVKNNSVEGDSNTFYLDEDSSGRTTVATLRKVISGISTEFGNKTLNVWVSDDSFDSGSGCSKDKCVTQTMVDALADIFLKSGADNDIYDWVTNIFSEEWGSDAKATYSNLIDETNQVDILLTDIDNDNSTYGGVVGYFYSKDNYLTSSLSGSNERIMFYADAVLFANGDGSWDINDFWPKEMISTLSHEFQHMIHFYQKTILRAGDGTDIWLNEMLSETVEEVISTKIEHDGPRGVDYTDGSAGPVNNPYGRYPDFNSNNTLSLTTWSGTLADYSKVNAFGAYLTRNYGVQVLHDIVHTSLTNKDAVVNAIHNTPNGTDKSFEDLLREWGIAVMLSDHTNLQDLPQYNTGDFILDTYRNSTYQLGSINFFHYDPQPTLYTTNGTVRPDGNFYYKIGERLSGKVDINITLNGTTEATLIAK